MAGDETLKALLTKIDRLVAKAKMSSNTDEQRSHLEEALLEACAYLQGLKREIGATVTDILKRGNFDPKTVSAPLADIASSDPQLEVFRKEATLVEFLRQMKGFLVQYLELTPEAVDAIIKETEKSYRKFMSERLDVQDIEHRVADLEKFFCRPPFGAGGIVEPKPSGSGGGGGTFKERAGTVLTWAGSLAGIGSFLYEVLKPLVGGHAMKQEKMLNDQLRLQVLGIMLLVGLSKMLEENKEIPPVGVKLPKGELVGA